MFFGVKFRYLEVGFSKYLAISPQIKIKVCPPGNMPVRLLGKADWMCTLDAPSPERGACDVGYRKPTMGNNR